MESRGGPRSHLRPADGFLRQRGRRPEGVGTGAWRTGSPTPQGDDPLGAILLPGEPQQAGSCTHWEVHEIPRPGSRGAGQSRTIETFTIFLPTRQVVVRVGTDGQPYWSARDLAKLFGYSENDFFLS